MKVIVKKAFEWWFRGVDPVVFQPGPCDLPDECVAYALDKGFAVKATARKDEGGGAA